MRHIDSSAKSPGWIVDYSAARAKAIEWLGDRYLLARPVNRITAAAPARGERRPALTIVRS
jgi:hypothetical protein